MVNNNQISNMETNTPVTKDVNTAPAIREDVVGTLTETEVHEWLRRTIASAQGAGSLIELLELNATRYAYQAADHSPAAVKVYVWGRIAGEPIGLYNQPSISAALVSFASKTSEATPSKVAGKKRAEAAKLIAEAETLEAKEGGV